MSAPTRRCARKTDTQPARRRRTFHRFTATNDGELFGERVMNNFSLLAADRVAHLKVVTAALILATLVEWAYALVVLSEQLR